MAKNPKRQLKKKIARHVSAETVDRMANAKVSPETVTDPQELTTHSSGEKQGNYRNPPDAYKFKPGHSGNPAGRPKDLLKQIGLNISSKKAAKILAPEELELIRQLDMNPNDITLIEAVMVMLGTSTNPDKLSIFLDRTFGKVPNININAEISHNIVQRFSSKLTDAELERIKAGEDALEILLDKLPDVADMDNIVDVETDE